MDMNHLPEETLQKIAEGKRPTDKAVYRHLDHCGQCRESLSAYRELLAGLQDDRGFLLSADFADQVIQKSGLRREGVPGWLDTFLLVASICSGLAVTGYYLLKSAFFENIGNVVPLFRVEWHSLPTSGISQNGLMLIFAFIILLFFGLMDRFLRPGSPPRTR